MKNLEQKDGFINRHINGLPKEKTVIKIIVEDSFGIQLLLCEFTPHSSSVSNGFLGTARLLTTPGQGVGYNAWEQNDSEFVYYRIIE